MADPGAERKDFVAEAHARGLLTFHEVAKLLDLSMPEVILLMRDGHIESERIDKKPCASLPALDAYRRRQIRQAAGIPVETPVSPSSGGHGPSPSSNG